MGTKIKIKKGDRVQVLSGKDKGSKGVVKKVMPKSNKVILEGINLVKKHVRPSMKSSGGIITKEAPIDVSNVAYIDPQTNLPTKVAYKILDDGRKARIAKRSGEIID
ncbi:50S ribosomal protein L24 [Rickettsiales bacterium Ac37b]|nr:50S ribosomal protein L24 [Rickettsiales bacterium Ac37b]